MTKKLNDKATLLQQANHIRKQQTQTQTKNKQTTKH